MADIEFFVERLTALNPYSKITSINISLHSGEILGIVGLSGAGKSTVLLSILGLNKRLGGRIKVVKNGKEVKLRDVIGYSPQTNALYYNLTLHENIHITAKLHGMEKLEAERYAKKLYSELKLTGHEHKLIKQLSGGMRKRADLACALIHKPDILVLDEPFAGLDVSVREFIWLFLKKLSEQGAIIILTSHLLSDIKKYCTDYGLVENGVYYGTDQIIKAMKQSNINDVETFMELRFLGQLR